MKEAIKVLKRLKRQLSKLPEHTTTQTNTEEIQAIENVLNRLKELEENCKKCVVRERLNEYVENSISKDKLLKTIDFSVQATDTNDNYSVGMCNGMLYIKSVILDKDIEYKKCPNNSISKDKIREMLEENNLPLTIVGGRRNGKTLEYGIKLGREQVLKELLEEE